MLEKFQGSIRVGFSVEMLETISKVILMVSSENTYMEEYLIQTLNEFLQNILKDFRKKNLKATIEQFLREYLKKFQQEHHF